MTQPGQVRTERLAERSRNPRRLGRHVAHDPRSLAFAAPVLPRSAIVSKRWTRRAPVWDQTSYSCCVPDTAAGWAVTDNATRPGLTHAGDALIDQDWVLNTLYPLVTQLDEFPWTWPPQDSGSSGLGGAKALRSLGLAPTYRHAFTLQAAQSALQDGPVMVGTVWLNSMFDPAADGRIRVDMSTDVAGGHEYLVDELDMEAGRVWIQNSWGDWGIGGRGYLSFADLTDLLAQDGDVTVPAAPADAPTPTPAAPAGCLGRILNPLFKGAHP